MVFTAEALNMLLNAHIYVYINRFSILPNCTCALIDWQLPQCMICLFHIGITIVYRLTPLTETLARKPVPPAAFDTF